MRNKSSTHSLKTEPSVCPCRKPSGPTALAASSINLASPGTSTVKRPNNGIARSILSFALLFTISCGPPPDSASDVRAATDAIQQQIANYTAPLDAADINLASQVWLTSPDVSFIHPAVRQK